MNKQSYFKHIFCAISFTFCLLLNAQVDSIVPKRFVFEYNSSTYKIPFEANADIERSNDAVEHAIFVMHGSDRNADDYFDNMVLAAEDVSDSILIVAPQFLVESDIEEHNLIEEYLYFYSGWRSGGLSVNNDSLYPRADRISAFSVLDSMILRVVKNYTNLKSLIFTGHSAGGQVTNRYSISSPIADILCEQYGVRMTFIVMNPSSYVYFNEERWIQNDNGDFEFEIPDASECTAYNEWGYGMDDLYNYPTRVGVDSMFSMFPQRNIHFTLGDADTSTTSSSLATSCSAMLLGRQRFERGNVYYQHLLDVFGEEIKERMTLDTIVGVGHSSRNMYTSDILKGYLFNNIGQGCQRRVKSRVEQAEICSDDSILFGGKYYSVAGNYFDTIAMEYYDTIIELKLVTHLNQIVKDTISVLSSNPFKWNGVYIDTFEKVYYDTIVNNDCKDIYGLFIQKADSIDIKDTLLVRDTLTIQDTINFIDTILFRDTLNVIDTIRVSVEDTLVISLSNLTNSTNITNTITVYPNPANNQLNIEFNELGNFSIELYNLQGQSLFTNSNVFSNLIIDLSSYSQGVYSLVITDNSGVSKKEVRKILLE